ncbi:hypothetical protein N7471_012591 [Penicillium samsonianum]|uniref:uncharacterized protein n=1 Tax=Penicillium samsonianum TaxID=1882272 RepID=UPI0025498679|nr:uncharacterized protein N7471_012591 [Penicillium samsonianum]KAJ6125274.1 hypothetical protein N7471_012591 [Penicillium samsonianum]
MENGTYQDETIWAPGTVRLEDTDPNDPLNWSTARKILNFTLVSFFVLWTFVQLDIGFTSWGPMREELNFTVEILNAHAAVMYSDLGFALCIWKAEMHTTGDIVGSALISGIGSAISEIIVLITIADMFFVHQHATMTGWHVIIQCTGAYLGPVASGYIVVSQG